jgi:exopolyphosphatase/guanosine-5'-triphosphate,3'-diphosphate pyrophosphatase
MARAYQALSRVRAAHRSARADRRWLRRDASVPRRVERADVSQPRSRKDLGLKFDVISAEDEARLSVLGCAALLERDTEHAMIVDIGGGSTELSWVSPNAVLECAGLKPPIISWGTCPLGVVTLAEDDAEPEGDAKHEWYEALVTRLADTISGVGDAQHLRQAFAEGRGHIIGTSGTVTSLAGVFWTCRATTAPGSMACGSMLPIAAP